MKAEEKVTVLDVLNYRASMRQPLSGFAIAVLSEGCRSETEVTGPEEFLAEVRAFKRREKRPLRRLYRWLKWQYYRRRCEDRN